MPDTSNAYFKAFMFPIMLIIILVSAFVLNHKKMIVAVKKNGAHPSAVWLMRIAVINTVLSVFLLFTTAWHFALLSALICYVIALFVAEGTLGTQGRTIMTVQLIWFAMLIGVPDFLTAGEDVFYKISSNNTCTDYYEAAADNLCAEGWLTFVEIIAAVLVGTTFLSLLFLVSFGIASDDESGLELLFGSDGTYSTVGSRSKGEAAVDPPTPKGGRGEYIEDQNL